MNRSANLKGGSSQIEGHAAASAPGTEERVEIRSPAEAESSSFRARHFTERTTLSWWLPQILDDENNKWRIWPSKRSRAILIQITLIVVIFVTNLALTIFAVSLYGSKAGVGVIYEGDCGIVNSLDRWLHLLINLLGTGILSAC